MAKSVLFITTSELMELKPQEWLIRHLLPEEGQALLFGPPGEGKSFVALDWALCVATGTPWMGKYAARQGHVVYIASEGGRGLVKRVAAWQQFHYDTDQKLMTNVRWYLGSLDIPTPGVIEAFMEELEQHFPDEPVQDPDTGEWELPLNLRLVVVDTLSRNFGGEDENTSAMAKFVDQLQLFAEKHHALVLVVHHSNATGLRERGHTALKAGMEASFHCTATKANGTLDVITLENNKQKDDRQDDAVKVRAARLELPELPRTEDGEIQTSLVLIEAPDGSVPAPIRPPTLPPLMSSENMFAVLAATEHGLTNEEWRLACRLNKDQFYYRLRRLIAAGRVSKNADTFRFEVVAAEEDE